MTRNGVLTLLYFTMYSKIGAPPSSCLVILSLKLFPLLGCPCMDGGLGSPKYAIQHSWYLHNSQTPRETAFYKNNTHVIKIYYIPGFNTCYLSFFVSYNHWSSFFSSKDSGIHKSSNATIVKPQDQIFCVHWLQNYLRIVLLYTSVKHELLTV